MDPIPGYLLGGDLRTWGVGGGGETLLRSLLPALATMGVDGKEPGGQWIPEQYNQKKYLIRRESGFCH